MTPYRAALKAWLELLQDGERVVRWLADDNEFRAADCPIPYAPLTMLSDRQLLGEALAAAHEGNDMQAVRRLHILADRFAEANADWLQARAQQLIKEK